MLNKTHGSARRIVVLDLLRGYCLMVIIVDHLLRFPSLYDPLTGRGLLWVSAAGGFFFLSGAVTTIVRQRQLMQKGWEWTTSKIWKRAGQLYLANLILTLLFTAISRILITNPDIKPGLNPDANWVDIITQTLALQYTYGWADFLVYYTVFLVITPIALWLLSKRLWWVLFGLSLAGWVLQHVTPTNFATFYLVWQGYYFSGMVAAYLYPNMAKAFRSLTPARQKHIAIGIVAATAITMAASVTYVFVPTYFANNPNQLPSQPELAQAVQTITTQSHQINSYVNDNRTGLLRLPLAWLWFTAFYIVFYRYQKVLTQKLGWFLIPMGQNSLYVYIIQAFAVYFVAFIHLPNNIFFNTLIVTAVLAATWWVTSKRWLFNIIPR